LLAAALLAGIVVGLPAVLVTIAANPLPTSWPTWEQAHSALTAPDDGTLALRALTLTAWAAWAFFTGTVLLEIAARARGVPAPHLPGLRAPQLAVRGLVAAAALLVTGAPLAGPPAAAAAASPPAAAAPHTAPNATARLSHTTAAATTAPALALAPLPPRVHTVSEGDTLSRIAARELGDADRWPEIAHLNPDVAADPDLIHPGDVLQLPTPPQTPTHRYTVEAGDTLSEIAARELGDPDRYPEIFTASRGLTQPDGTHLSDPDEIDVGQHLVVPGTATSSSPAATRPDTYRPVPSTNTPRPARPAAAPPHRTDPDTQRPSSGSTHSPRVHAAQRPGVTDDRRPGADASAASPGRTVAAPRTPAAEQAVDETASPAWALAGLTGAGALLAGSLLVELRRRRHAQLRNRRPGRTLSTPDPILSPVEKTLTAIGDHTAPTVHDLDTALRGLAEAVARDGLAMPAVRAVQLTDTDIVLHLPEPGRLPAPWTSDGDGRRWHTSTAAAAAVAAPGPEAGDQPAPYPLLVTVGVDDAGATWLLNLEDLDVAITGDPTFGRDFARFLAAEVACNARSAGVTLACVGVAAEVAPMSPDRVRVYGGGGAGDADDPVQELLTDAQHTLERAVDTGTDVATARARQAGADPWPAQLLLLDATVAGDHPALPRLLDLLHTHPGRTATAVVVSGAHPGTGTVLEVTANGRVTFPHLGLDLEAAGLTSDEAAGCATLLAHAATATDAPLPVDTKAADGWQSRADTAGALRDEHTLPRHGDPGHDGPAGRSLLEADDDTYTGAAATTEQDLATLAPRASDIVRRDVEDADPTLDADLAMWFRDDAALPKLHLLGPVHATTRGRPLTKRKPYMTELLAFLALRRHGATPEEVADAFGISKAKARDYVLTVRQWLGSNPRTCQPHLPDARLAPAAQVRGVPVYQVVDLLIDADLFRRLRLRGQARGGPAGIADLRTALRLVHGRPFDYPLEREGGGGWAWLLDGDRLDEHLAVAVVDVAHLVTTDALADGDLPTARLAAETAALAAPHEEIPRLDLAAVAAAEGHHDQARRIIRDEVCNRTDDDGPPPEIPARTERILASHRDWLDHQAS
jgi:nucleoid-associated protein YgaU